MLAKLTVVCQKQSNNTYYAMCPELPGCYTQGDTYEQTLDNLKELARITLKEELEEMTESGIFLDKVNIFSEMVLEIS